jgi:hypothetical protein
MTQWSSQVAALMLILTRKSNTMKKILAVALSCSLLYACSDDTKKENAIKNEVISMHEKLMNNDEVLMKNKMKLDTLLTQKKDTAAVKPLIAKAIAADDAMEQWMSKFQPDMTGKSHDEVMKYYTDQKKQIVAVDSQINVAIKESGQYLSNHK